MERFPDFPADIRKNALVQTMSVPDLLKFCSTSREYRDLCRDPKTWVRLIQRDFGWSPERIQGTRVDPKHAYQILLRQYPEEFNTVGFNPRGLYLILNNARKWSRNKNTYLDLLVTTPDIGPITQLMPLDMIRLSYSSSGELEYEFVSQFNPDITAILIYFPQGWELTITYRNQAYFQIAIYTPVQSSSVPIIIEIVDALRHVNFNTAKPWQIEKILQPIIDKWNLLVNPKSVFNVLFDF